MSGLRLTPLGDPSAVVCEGDVCFIPDAVPDAAAESDSDPAEI